MFGLAIKNVIRLRDDRRGVSTAGLALTLLPLAAGLGLSADLGRIYAVKSHIQDAIESSAFAASRTYQITHDESDAIEMANQVFEMAQPSGIVAGITGITIDRRTNLVIINASATVPMALIGRVTAIARSMQIEATASVTAPAPPRFRGEAQG